VRNAVASQVVFIDGNPAKQHYRHCKIQELTVTGHRMILQSWLVIQRRLQVCPRSAIQRVGNPDWPDLVMIDGGKGQLSSVVEVLQEMNLIEELRVVSLC